MALLLGASGVAACGGGDSTTTDTGTDDGATEVADDAEVADETATEDVAAEDVGGDDGATDTGPGCGDGVLAGDEVCDGFALGGASCESLGYTTGTLACTPGCLFDETGCSSACDNGTCERGETATSCPGDCGVVDVATGSYHTCAVLADGSLWCWGAWIGHRAGGLGDERVPVKVAGVSGLTGICSGVGHSCVTTSDGRVLCWGRNGFGEAGQSPRHALIFPPAEVPDLAGAEDLTCGLHHTCVQVDGDIRCWGRNDYGQLGTTYSVRHEEPSTVALTSGGFSDVGAGARHTCGVSGSGARRYYWCWGFGGTGALGRGNLAWSITPVGGGALDIVQIEAGTFHTCSVHRTLLSETGSINCWGSNEHGQVGVANAGPLLSPTGTGVREVRVLALGRAHSCAGGTTRTVCWGLNEHGQLGDGTTTSTYVAQPVALTGVTALASLWDHTCAILADHTLRCWGVNERGQLGDGTTEAMRSTPVEPVGL